MLICNAAEHASEAVVVAMPTSQCQNHQGKISTAAISSKWKASKIDRVEIKQVITDMMRTSNLLKLNGDVLNDLQR